MRSFANAGLPDQTIAPSVEALRDDFSEKTLKDEGKRIDKALAEAYEKPGDSQKHLVFTRSL